MAVPGLRGGCAGRSGIVVAAGQRVIGGGRWELLPCQSRQHVARHAGHRRPGSPGGACGLAYGEGPCGLFSDESERSGLMLFGVVLVSTGDLAPRVLRWPACSSRASGGCTPPTSPTAGARSCSTPWPAPWASQPSCSATAGRHRRPLARHLLLQAATGLVVGSGVSSWALDNQVPAQVLRDRASIAHALDGVDRHLHPATTTAPASEPLLWAADAICWAVGAGGDWQRRLGSVVTVRDLGPGRATPGYSSSGEHAGCTSHRYCGEQPPFYLVRDVGEERSASTSS